ncbi:MAG: DUF1800 domain-containing protein [Planctomycetes bacterium]|nr:DUF1800 domain-containing protein [Planctomycetota bacterium]
MAARTVFARVAASTFFAWGLIWISIAAIPAAVFGDEPQAELDAAQKAYSAYYTEWDSLAMARAATREVSVSARRFATEDLNEWVAARDAVAKAQAALDAARAALAAATADPKTALEEGVRQRETELAQADQTLAQRVDRARNSVHRMMLDQHTAMERTEGFLESEYKLGGLLEAIWTANGKVLTAKADAAEKTLAEKAGAPPEEVAKLKAESIAARRAVQENELLARWEKSLWAQVIVTYPDTTSLVSARGDTADAARIAEQIAGLEADAALKQRYTEFAVEQRAYETKNQGRIDDLLNQSKELSRGTYAMRAAAMGGLEPLPEDQWDRAKARHLLVRAGFGGTPAEVDQLHKMGLHGAVDHLVDFALQPATGATLDAAPSIPADVMAGKLRHGWTREQVFRQPDALDVGRVRRWWFARMVESPRPLQEKLTLFWHGHFATQQSVVGTTYTIYRQNELFREHAAGNFGALLYGVVHDPAMIRYLDNNSNVKGHANENLAREIMELFAMGAYQGYDENDVREAAKALTGYTFDPRSGQFRYLYANHDLEEKTVFGKKGPWTGDDLVRLILDQPSTSRFVSKKLFEFFVYSDPSAEVIDRMTSVLQYQNYELTPMLKNLFLSKEFYGEQAMGTQIKCPVQLVVGTMRDLGIRRMSDYGVLDRMTIQMGQQLFEPPDVKGWRYGRTWISTDWLFTRYNAVAELIRSAPQPERQGADLMAYVRQGGCATGPEAVDFLARSFLALPLSAEKRAELIQYLGELPPAGEWDARRDEINARLQNVLIFLTSSPEFQVG